MCRAHNIIQNVPLREGVCCATRMYQRAINGHVSGGDMPNPSQTERLARHDPFVAVYERPSGVHHCAVGTTANETVVALCP